MDADEDFAFADLGDRDGFQADIVFAAIDRRLHGGGYEADWGFYNGLSSYGHNFNRNTFNCLSFRIAFLARGIRFALRERADFSSSLRESSE
jgi:hypothetical protein